MIAIGLMSGTSLDGVDAILVEIKDNKYNPLKFVTLPYEENFKKRILKNLSDASAKLSEISSLNYELGYKFVDAIDLLLNVGANQKDDFEYLALLSAFTMELCDFAYDGKLNKLSSASLTAKLVENATLESVHVEFLCANTNFCTKTKTTPVTKPC